MILTLLGNMQTVFEEVTSVALVIRLCFIFCISSKSGGFKKTTHGNENC